MPTQNRDQIRTCVAAALAGSLAFFGMSGAPLRAEDAAGPSTAAAGPGAAASPTTLSIDQAVDLALRQSPTLEVSRRERNVALLEADRNRPAFRPEVTATASQLLRTPRVDLPGRPDDVVLPNSISRLEIGVRQPLYQFGAGSAPGARAQAMAGAAHSDYRKAELDTALEAREAYLDLLHASAMEEVARRGEELARENVRVTRLLQERGFQAEVDVLEAERSLAEAEAGRLRAENGTALAKANLNRVLGRPVDTPFTPAPAPDLPGDPGSLSELLPRALAQRPEILTLRHNMEAAGAGIKLARASGLPRVNLEAAYALQTETALVPHNGVGAGVTITAPIFDGGLRRTNVREAEERLAQLRGALQAQEGGIALEVERQRLAMQEARARIEAADRGVAAATKAYDIVRARQDLGRAIQVEVLNARQGLERALSDRAAAEHDLRLARVRLDRALGEGVR